MVNVSSIGQLVMETPDLEKQVEYYSSILGLSEIGNGPGESFFACPGDACSIILKKGDVSRCATLTLRLPAETDKDTVLRKLSDHGIDAAVAADLGPDMPWTITLEGPEGLPIALVPETSATGRSGSGGIGPNRLGHVAFVCADPQKMVEFFTEVLGFRVSDWMSDFFVFMRCGPDHHTVNFIRGDKLKLHHQAYEARDFMHIRDTCDFLGAQRIPILWGPGRHGVGHNIFTYHHNPDGQIVEVYTELDQMSDEANGFFDPQPWHEDQPQRPKVWEPGVFTSNIWGIPTPEVIRK